jgi:hypothetical protein
MVIPVCAGLLPCIIGQRYGTLVLQKLNPESFANVPCYVTMHEPMEVLAYAVFLLLVFGY